MRDARQGIIGLLLMPFLPLLLADALFLSHGIDAFHHFVSVPATVVAVGVERMEVRTRKTGSEYAGAMERLRPQITYRFEFDGHSHLSSRYFLMESTALTDAPEDQGQPGSVSQRMARHAVPGRVMQVYVARAEPSVSYVDFGWAGLAHVVRFWGGIYLFFAAVILLFCWLIQASGQGVQAESSGK
jgi:hypothetical protein